MTKLEIRSIARELGLRVADKADSQEICFVPGSDYKEFLRSHLGEGGFHRGGIYSVDGKFIGEHSGIELFTIGQRKGLPGGFSKPLYVVDIDPETRSVIVGAEEELIRDEFEVDRVNWLVPASEVPEHLTVKIRYAHPGTPASLEMLDGKRVRIQLRVPQRAVTPGQAAVFYDGDRVVGGGWILRKPALAAA
jgi:tRNA-specific 2-thiouridylase